MYQESTPEPWASFGGRWSFQVTTWSSSRGSSSSSSSVREDDDENHHHHGHPLNSSVRVPAPSAKAHLPAPKNPFSWVDFYTRAKRHGANLSTRVRSLVLMLMVVKPSSFRLLAVASPRLYFVAAWAHPLSLSLSLAATFLDSISYFHFPSQTQEWTNEPTQSPKW